MWARCIAAAVVGATVLGCASPGLGEKVMRIHYLEIVTNEVDAVCAAYAAVNGVQFQTEPTHATITTMTLEETLTQLETLGNEKMRAQNAKRGAGDNQFGVRRGDVRNYYLEERS